MFRGARRRHLALLVGAGLGQALAGGVGVIALKRCFHSSGGSVTLPLGVLLLAAVSIGLLRMAERSWAEQLGQHYVHEIRGRLLRASLDVSQGRSLGVTVARTTNDLSAIRNWMAMGVAPLAAGVPLLLGALVVLGAIDPVLAVAAAVPLLLLAMAFLLLAPVAYERSRRQRRLRGRLAAHIADTVLATAAIRASSGEARELRRLQARSDAVVDAAIARARVGGALRGSAAAASGAATASVVAAGVWQHAPTSTIAAAITVVGILAAPVHDLGRGVEYRQMYRAARRIIGPVVHRSTPQNSLVADRPARQLPVALPGCRPGSLHVRDLPLPDGTRLPALDVAPGARVVIEEPDRQATAAVLETLAGLVPAKQSLVMLDGHDVHTLPPRQRRRRIGYAAQGMRLERGTLGRAIRYRTPDLDPSATSDAFDTFGLQPTVQRLPKGADTTLRHGGEPLTAPERALVHLARAMLGPPQLLLLNHIDNDLTPLGLDILRQQIAAYPGIVIIASAHASDILTPTHVWPTVRPCPERPSS